MGRNQWSDSDIPMFQVNPDSHHRTPPPAKPEKPARGLKCNTKDRAKYDREAAPARRSYVQEVGYCEVHWILDRVFINDNLCCHEIARGVHRKAALKHRFAQLVACDECNMGRLNDYSKCPIVRQLAIKLLSDSDWFDLAAFNKLRGRAEGAITLAEVVCEVFEIFKERG